MADEKDTEEKHTEQPKRIIKSKSLFEQVKDVFRSKKPQEKIDALYDEADAKIKRLAGIALDAMNKKEFKEELELYKKHLDSVDVPKFDAGVEQISKNLTSIKGKGLVEGEIHIDNLKKTAASLDTIHKQVEALPKEGLFENLKHGLKVIGEALALILSVLTLRFVREYQAPEEEGFGAKVKATGEAIKAGAHSFFEADEVSAMKEMARTLEKVETKIAKLEDEMDKLAVKPMGPTGSTSK